MNDQALDRLAYGLGTLADPTLQNRVLTALLGWHLLNALQTLDSAGTFVPDAELLFYGKKLAGLGFAYESTGRFHLLNEGRRFIGSRKPAMNELQPGWIRISNGRSDVSINLCEPAHLDLLVRMLSAGYQVAAVQDA